MRMQAHLALCCKAMLPIISMGHLVVRAPGNLYGGRPIRQVTRLLTKQPGNVSHLELRAWDHILGTGRLIELRCTPTLCAWPHGAEASPSL